MFKFGCLKSFFELIDIKNIITEIYYEIIFIYIQIYIVEMINSNTTRFQYKLKKNNRSVNFYDK